MAVQQYEVLLTDLIDLLTIAQIKETLFEGEASHAATGDLQRASADVSELLKARSIHVTARVVRLIMLLAQANLQVWLNKDRMTADPQRYEELLEYAQELNGLRNHARNLLMKRLGEWTPATERSTFLSLDGGRWYSRLLEDLRNE